MGTYMITYLIIGAVALFLLGRLAWRPTRAERLQAAADEIRRRFGE